MITKMIDRISTKSIYFIFMIGFWMSMIPVILLGFFGSLQADDFSASDTVRHAWIETGSIRKVLEAAIENTVWNYQEISGVFASVFFTSFQPSVFGEEFYGVSTLLIVSVVCGGSFFLARTVFVKYLQADKYTAGCIAGLFLFLLIHCMPDATEGLYWHAGSVNYTLAFGFMLWLIGLQLTLHLRKADRKSLLLCLVACVLAICVGGGNLITALCGVILVVGLQAVLVWYQRAIRRQLENMLLWLPVVILLAAFFASIFSPGNNARISLMSSGLSPLKAIGVSLYYGLDLPVSRWGSWYVFCLMLLALPFLWAVAKNSSFSFPLPGLAVMMSYGVSSAAFTPPLYATGNILAGRIQNTAFYIWLLCTFFGYFYVVGWICKKLVNQQREDTVFWRIRNWYCLFLAGILIVGSVAGIQLGREMYVGSSAAISLISGQAGTYREENLKRLEVYKNPDLQQVRVEPYSNPPELLFFQDIAEDETDWINQAVARYYGKESVKLSGE